MRTPGPHSAVAPSALHTPSLTTRSTPSNVTQAMCCLERTKWSAREIAGQELDLSVKVGACSIVLFGGVVGADNFFVVLPTTSFTVSLPTKQLFCSVFRLPGYEVSNALHLQRSSLSVMTMTGVKRTVTRKVRMWPVMRSQSSAVPATLMQEPVSSRV